jgi:hypothetical protein
MAAHRTYSLVALFAIGFCAFCLALEVDMTAYYLSIGWSLSSEWSSVFFVLLAVFVLFAGFDAYALLRSSYGPLNQCYILFSAALMFFIGFVCLGNCV